MTSNQRRTIAPALLTLLVACGGDDPAAPDPAALVLTFIPTPVNTIGVSSICMGATAKTWVYDLRIENTGGEPFEVSSWSWSYSASSDFSSPATQALGGPSSFTAAFGVSAIAPGQTVERELCTALVVDQGWITYSVTGDAGSFTSPVVHLLP